MKTAFVIVLAVIAFGGTFVVAQTGTPQVYTVSAQLTDPGGATMDMKIYRDGSRERIETSFRGRRLSTTLIDIAGHKVYWLDTAGPGTCSAGHYVSNRPPLEQDPVAASVEKLPKGQRRLIRTEAVNGIPARLEEITPANKTEKAGRVWIADPGNFVVKMEGEDKAGKPMVFFEVKQWGTDKPSAALFTPPADCIMTNSEMDEMGNIRAHAESTIKVKTSGSTKLK